SASSYFFFSSRRRHTRSKRDWSSDVCSSDLGAAVPAVLEVAGARAVVLAFYDSGFTLADPVSGRAVVLVRYGAVRDALPPEARGALDAAFAGEAPEGPALGLRYLVCGTVAGRTLLPALPGAALTRRAGSRVWRETELLAAF